MVSDFAVGAVLKPNFSGGLVRVLAFDEAEAMLDEWRADTTSWGFAKLTGNAIYSRTPRALLATASTCLRIEPLTDAEFETHRPDLPLRLGIDENLSWPAVSDLPAFSEHIARHVVATIPIRQLYLSPFTAKGSIGKSSLVEFDGTVADLVARAAAIQAPLTNGKLVTRGVGIFRSGFRNRIPSFYLWGTRSRAEP